MQLGEGRGRRASVNLRAALGPPAHTPIRMTMRLGRAVDGTPPQLNTSPHDKQLRRAEDGAPPSTSRAALWPPVQTPFHNSTREGRGRRASVGFKGPQAAPTHACCADKDCR
eukprot:13150034-Alexandrium_andersonii.AAC.1